MTLRFFSSLKLLAPLRHPQLQTKLVQSSHPTVQLHNCHITLLLLCSSCPSISSDSMYWVGESFRCGPHLCLHCVNTEHVKKMIFPIWHSICWRLLPPQIFWQSCSYKFSHIRLRTVSKVSESKLKWYTYLNLFWLEPVRECLISGSEGRYGWKAARIGCQWLPLSQAQLNPETGICPQTVTIVAL